MAGFLTSLLHPSLFLWFLPLVAIPIILHLLTLHRLKTVELSTFRFLFDSYLQQRRRTRFLEALLAALRTAFLLFLVLALSRPVVRHWSSLFTSGSGREVILLVDCSASMNARTAGVPAFDRAKAAAHSVADNLGRDDRLTLIRVLARPEEVFSRFGTDAEAIRDKIQGLKTSPGRANMLAALMAVFGPEAQARDNPVVYVFTDCQQSGWNEVQKQGLDRVIPDGTPVTVVNVGSNQAVANLAVIGDTPRRGHAVVGLPVMLYPHVANYSPVQADAEVVVYLDEKEVSRARLTLKPGEKARRKVIYFPSEPGTHYGRFEVTGKAAGTGKPFDQFPDDDHFLFTLSVQPRLKVLLVNGAPAPDPLQNETLNLTTALSVVGTEERSVEKTSVDRHLKSLLPGKDFLRSLDVQEIAEPAVTPQALQDASVVVLANCGTLNAQHFIWLRDFVQAGGGLLIFPGERVTPDLYNQQFFAVPGPQEERLIGVQLGQPEGDPDRLETFERLANIDFAHPVFAPFEEADAKYFKQVLFYRRFPLTAAQPDGSQTVTLAEFAGGSPALVESRFGEGRVVLAAFPASSKWTNLPAKDVRWTNLPLKVEFVPLLLRLVSHLQRRPEVLLRGPAVVRAGEPVEVAVPEGLEPLSVQKVIDPAKRSTELTFERSGPRLVAAYERTAERGYYAVEVRGGSTDASRGGKAAFAVNLAPEESDFTALGEAKLRELLPTAKLTYVDASAQAQQANGAVGSEKDEIWRPLIWLLFAVIGVEFLLATVRGGRKETDEDLTVTERIRRLSPGTWVGRMTGAGKKE
jgi:hypothetical protein